MGLIWLVALAASLGAMASEDTIDIGKIPFNEEVSRKIASLEWSVFGKSTRKTQPDVYRNSYATTLASTPSGSAEGILTQTHRKELPYAAFFGMPYAKPPIGDLRFSSPITADPWEGTYDATYERPSCLQYQGNPNEESEDCLYINVYTPNLEKTDGLMPVMVYIHGGAFIGGSSNSSIFSPDYFIDEGVILVTFNYRLGPLGFLSLQTKEVPGNAGLKDQALALRWVQKHIESFGGDPKKVTIFGESAGSASVNYHLLSPSSKGLFSAAILQSGTANTPWAYVSSKDVLRMAVSLASKVNCHSKVLSEILKCLRRVPASKLTENQQGALTIEDMLRIRPFTFVPTDEPKVDGAFLTVDPTKAQVYNNYNKVPIIIGSNSGEGLITLPVFKTLDPMGLLVGLIGVDLSIFYPHDLRANMNLLERTRIHNEIKNFYFGMQPVSLATRPKLIDLISDTSFMMPIIQTAALLTKSEFPIYNYIFTYDGPYGFYKLKLGLSDEEGVCHGDELGYLFYDDESMSSKCRFDEEAYKEADLVVDRMIRLWTNFAKYGDPTPPSDDLITEKWNPRNISHHVLMDIAKDLRPLNSPGKELLRKINFWYDMVKNYK